ncbi:MAG TPA: HAD-IIIA family hydrolase [Gaiellaceae bacterium]|nr:HAD-IIIA family hydrolase [Gaiellaceae bacterium]
MRFDVVIPTVGRPSLGRLLAALDTAEGPRPSRVIAVVDEPGAHLTDCHLRPEVDVLRGRGAGPAAARNLGWRASSADWIAFLDDDVVPEPTWLADLAADLAFLSPAEAGSQGRIRVPLPVERSPTDWERNVSGLETAAWATADMAVRRDALEAVGGFDERFPRAYREDADLALRLLERGFRLVRGRRTVSHPVGPNRPLDSVRRQAGNADDALMRALHGRDWRCRASAPSGRFPLHAVITAAGVVALAARSRLAAAAWAAGTLELAWRRIRPGPRDPREVATMLLTSALIPPAATAYRLAGEARARRLARRADAVLLDRDGTLVVDVPYNAEPARVVPVEGARPALDRLRDAGIALAVVTNQSGVGRGYMTREQLRAVNERIEQLLGPFDWWAICTHRPDEACSCRKPGPGLVAQAAHALGADPVRCVVIGDIGSDVEAARAAGARAILVPNHKTRREEVAAAPVVAPTLSDAVDLVLGGRA